MFLALAAWWLGIFSGFLNPPAIFAQTVPQFRAAQLPPILDPPPTGNTAPAGNSIGGNAAANSATSPSGSSPVSAPSGAGFTGTEGLTTIPANSYAFQSEPPVVTPTSLFRNSQLPYGQLVALPGLGPNVASEDINGGVKLSLPLVEGGIPFLSQHGFQPQDADLKIGPVYLKVRELQAAYLFSDNINLTPVGQSGSIAFVGITIDIMAQITETLRIATEGTFVYLPIQNQAGIAGFGLSDFYNFGLVSGPLAHAQLAWDTQIGGWNVVFRDDFQVLAALFSNDFRSDDPLFEGGNFNDQAVAGRYILRPEQGYIFQREGPVNEQVNFRNNVVVYTNTVSAGVDRLLPGTIRLTARAYHQDVWYNQGTSNDSVTSVDGVTVALVSERENTRFKPYFIYDAFRTNEFSGVQNIFRLGVTGPITNQLNVLAEGGYYVGGLQGSGGLWRFQLNHDAGPYTQESIIWAREFNYFHDEIDDEVGYNFHQILGPKMNFDAYAYRILAEYSYSNGASPSEDQWRLGVRYTYNMGPRTSLRVTGEYGSFDPGATSWWLGRTELAYNLTDTCLLRFIYQYQQSRSELLSWNYKEDLFFISLTKYFR
jgi:hypothetical protein